MEIKIKERERERESSYVGDGAIGGAVGVNDPAGFQGEVTEDLIDVGAWGEWVTTVLAEAMEDFGGDAPSLPLSHLRFLFLPLALASSSSSCHFLANTVLLLSSISADSFTDVPDDHIHRRCMIYISRKKED